LNTGVVVCPELAIRVEGAGLFVLDLVIFFFVAGPLLEGLFLEFGPLFLEGLFLEFGPLLLEGDLNPSSTEKSNRKKLANRSSTATAKKTSNHLCCFRFIRFRYTIRGKKGNAPFYPSSNLFLFRKHVFQYLTGGNSHCFCWV